MTPKKSKPTPTLDRLRAEGKVWEEHGSFVGMAYDSEGDIVQFGSVHFPDQVERYLAANPHPSMW